MKSTLLNTFTLFGLTFFISACSSSGKPSDILISSSSNSATIEVERGPVKQANVTDANGKLARDLNSSNFYIFDSLPTYPITVTQGIIEINNDKNKTVVLDINMSSYTNVITPITTLLSESNKTKRDALEAKLMSDYNLTKEELYQSPSKTQNENIALLTNLIYKKVKENNSSIKNLFSYKTLITDSNTTLKNEFYTSLPIIDANSSLKTAGKIDSLKLENYFYDRNSSLFTDINTSAILPSKDVNASEAIENIWNIDFKVYTLTDYKNFNIGVRVIRHNSNGTVTTGEFVYSGLNIKNGVVSNPTRIDVYGVGSTGNTGGTFFDSQFNTGSMLENAIALNADTISLNVGYIMNHQTLVDASKFKVPADYDIIIVSSLPIFQYAINTSQSFIKGRYNFIDTKGMNGALTIH